MATKFDELIDNLAHAVGAEFRNQTAMQLTHDELYKVNDALREVFKNNTLLNPR